MALRHPDVTIEAITTVTGNVHVNNVIRNVFTVLDLMGTEVPIYRGADQPLVPGHWHPEVRYHGEDGLGGLKHRSPNDNRQPKATPASVALVRLANEMPGELVLVTLGPLTNIALACRLDPTFPQKIKQFVFMGGTISAVGNTENLSAEFNIFCDPEAALIALEAFPQATMLSWETTLKHTFSWKEFDRLSAMPTAAARFFHETTQTGIEFVRKVRPEVGFLLPDPLAMAIALEPDLILTHEPRYVTVELQGRHTRGQTVIDHFGNSGHAPDVDIATEVNTLGVLRLYEHMLS
jgi:purine nucleosidase